MKRDKHVVQAVTAALVGGPYRVEEDPLRSCCYVLGPNDQYFTSVRGWRIEFAPADAEKIVRLYNQDAHDHDT